MPTNDETVTLAIPKRFELMLRLVLIKGAQGFDVGVAEEADKPSDATLQAWRENAAFLRSLCAKLRA